MDESRGIVMKILFKNAHIIIPSGGSMQGHVAVENEKISYVGEDLPESSFDRVINCENKLLTPAFYNTHCHSAMTLLRGIGEDLPLARWLEEKIYPAEDKLTPASTRIGSELAIAEMIRCGCVSFSDMYFFCEATADAALACGVKANIARCLVSFSDDASIKTDQRFAEAVSLFENYNGAGDGKVKIDMSVHAEYTNCENYLREVAQYTAEHGLSMQVHVSETESEHNACMERHGGKTPVEFLTDCGILVPAKGATVTAAHCVYVSEHDIELLAQNNVSIAHNPVSNLKLASGIAPLHKLMAAGINVSLGTDGAASNNALSVLRELQTAALIHKGVTKRADLIPMADICRMGWENGARAQGRRDCGRIEVGCKADLVLYDLDALNNIPMYDPYATLAFSADGRDVSLTMCDGKILYENGEFKTLDVEKLRHEAKLITKQFIG